jgi:hypothetical protein
MKTLLSFFVLGVAAISHAQLLFSENFDSLTAGTNLNGVNGWSVSAFTDPSAVSATVESGQFNSAPHSARLVGPLFNSILLSRRITEWGLRDAGKNELRLSNDLFLTSGDSFVFTVALLGLGNIRFSTVDASPTATRLWAAGGSTASDRFWINHGEWHNFEFRINGLTGDSRFFVNGGQVFSGVFDVSQIADFQLGFRTSSGSGSMWVDNVKVEAVPEPVTMTGLAMGIAILARRRRRA